MNDKVIITVGSEYPKTHYYSDCADFKPGEWLQTTISAGDHPSLCRTCKTRISGGNAVPKEDTHD